MIITNPVDSEAILADRSVRAGPPIASASDYFYLRDEDYLEPGDLTDLAAIKERKLVAWSRGVNMDVVKAEDAGVPCILGPDYVFSNSFDREPQRDVFARTNVASVLVLNHSDYMAAQSFKAAQYRGTIGRVRHFLRPELYARPFFTGDRPYDVLVFIRSVLRRSYVEGLADRGVRVEYIQNGSFVLDELIYKAERAKLCIYDAQWESYGLAAQEIMACGCPLICNRNGIQEGNLIEGRMGFYVNNGLPHYDGTPASMARNAGVVMADDPVEMDRAVEVVSGWSNKDVYEASREFNDPVAVKRIYRNAIFGALGVFGKAYA